MGLFRYVIQYKYLHLPLDTRLALCSNAVMAPRQTVAAETAARRSKMESISLQDFIGNTAITAKVKRVERNPNMEDMGPGARHFIVTLSAGRFSMRVPFSQGSAHTADPTTADVLDCLASDAAGYENAKDFADWAGEYGYDTDSRKAERIYKVIAKQAAKLRVMLGQANYERLLWNTERL